MGVGGGLLYTYTHTCCVCVGGLLRVMYFTEMSGAVDNTIIIIK